MPRFGALNLCIPLQKTGGFKQNAQKFSELSSFYIYYNSFLWQKGQFVIFVAYLRASHMPIMIVECSQKQIKYNSYDLQSFLSYCNYLLVFEEMENKIENI